MSTRPEIISGKKVAEQADVLVPQIGKLLNTLFMARPWREPDDQPAVENRIRQQIRTDDGALPVIAIRRSPDDKDVLISAAVTTILPRKNGPQILKARLLREPFIADTQANPEPEVAQFCDEVGRRAHGGRIHIHYEVGTVNGYRKDPEADLLNAEVAAAGIIRGATVFVGGTKVGSGWDNKMKTLNLFDHTQLTTPKDGNDPVELFMGGGNGKYFAGAAMYAGRAVSKEVNKRLKKKR